jgi:hypothetical protein
VEHPRERDEKRDEGGQNRKRFKGQIRRRRNRR